MSTQTPPEVEPADDPVLARTLAAAGLPATGRFRRSAGWVSLAWVGDEHVVRVSDGHIRGAYEHEAAVVGLLDGTDVPHARHVAHGTGPDGPWYVSERLPGRTLHDAWPDADPDTRRSIIESLGTALEALHRVPAPAGLMPPWLIDALAGEPRHAYHPPVVGAAFDLVEDARRVPGHDPRLLDDARAWVAERLPLFAADKPALVHGDVHGSNVMVHEGRVSGLIDFAEAVAQPADAELDTILRWCARSSEFPPVPGGRPLDPASLAPVPGWLRGAYPALFARDGLRQRLAFYDMDVELAIEAHHPDEAVRATANEHIAGLLAGRSHLDALDW
jgi:hygromycin-B 7''-O-kinase